MAVSRCSSFAVFAIGSSVLHLHADALIESRCTAHQERRNSMSMLSNILTGANFDQSSAGHVQMKKKVVLTAPDEPFRKAPLEYHKSTNSLAELAMLALASPRSISGFEHGTARKIQLPRVQKHVSLKAPRLSAAIGDPSPAPKSDVWVKQAVIMWIAAAILGPLCDGRHSSHDVLHYAANSIAGSPWVIYAPGSGQALLETCWWVPIAFGGAGVILGASHPFLDRAWSGGPREAPGWFTVLASISAFVACYDLSGILAQSAGEAGVHDWLLLDAPLAACALAMFVVFERSPGGLLMMALLAIIGPIVEIGLINQLHLYEYTHADFAGIPSWIPWVYAAGGPANGALGRQVLAELEKAKK